MSTRRGVQTVVLLAALGLAGSWSNQTVLAQYHSHYHQHRHTTHHHHDAMGHRVDDAGHHIDLHGHHTGAVGVYDNGARSYSGYFGAGYPSLNYSTTYGGRPGYWSNGSFIYSSVPATPIVQGVVPAQPVVVSRPPQNVVPGMGGQPAPVPGRITILNPPGSGGEVRYRLNDSDFVIKEGFAQTIENDRNWIVHFDSGGSAGEVRYTLSPGTFKFKVTETGWNLLRTTDPIPTSPVSPAPSVRSDFPAPTPRPDGP